MHNPIRVIVVDSHPIVREGLKQFLEADGSSVVVGQAGDANSALKLCTENEHDVLVSNASVPGTDVLRFIESVKSANKETKVVICYIDEDLSLIREFKRSGTDGFIGQLATSGEYSAAVNAVTQGGTFFSVNLSAILFSETADARRKTNAYGLTARELDILALLSNGLCNKEIANEFDLSVRTVETHRLNIRRKTNSMTLSDLVRIARSLGIVGMSGARMNSAVTAGAGQEALNG